MRYNDGAMTRQQAIDMKRELEANRQELVRHLSAVDAQSASLSVGGGSKSYTNRSVADIKAKIKFIDGEIARLDAMLGTAPDRSQPQNVYIEFGA